MNEFINILKLIHSFRKYYPGTLYKKRNAFSNFVIHFSAAQDPHFFQSNFPWKHLFTD